MSSFAGNLSLGAHRGSASFTCSTDLLLTCSTDLLLTCSIFAPEVRGKNRGDWIALRGASLRSA